MRARCATIARQILVAALVSSAASVVGPACSDQASSASPDASGTNGDGPHDAGSDALSDSPTPEDAAAEDVAKDAGPCGLDQTFDCNDSCIAGELAPSQCVDGAWVCPPQLHDTCACLAAQWSSFVYHGGTCAQDTDCILVGGTNTCACAPALGSGSGEAIAKTAAAAANDFLERFEQCKYDPTFEGAVHCESAPGQNVRCENFKCVVDAATCSSASDAGDAALAGDASPGDAAGEGG
jgi:hypothetical protein